MTINRLFSITNASMILLALSLFNCGNTNNESEAAIDELPLSNEAELTYLDSAQSADILDQVYEDTIIYDENYYPIDSLMTMNLMCTGTFHEEEFSEEEEEDLDNPKWWGIFKNEDSTYLATTSLTTSRVNDPMLDEEDQKTGWSVKTTNPDENILLIEHLALFVAHKIDTVAIEKSQISPNDSVSYTYNSIDYALNATGDFRRETEGWPNFYNYKLYLSATIEGIKCQSLIAAAPRFDDAMITLLFCGDIDNDGILDFIFDTSSHYNGADITLYLSSERGKNAVVNPVGHHMSTGC